MKKKTIGKEYIFTALILFVVLAVTMVLDSQLPGYHIVIKVIKKASVYSLVAVSMNLLNGFTGLFSLGQAGFMLLDDPVVCAVERIPRADAADTGGFRQARHARGNENTRQLLPLRDPNQNLPDRARDRVRINQYLHELPSGSGDKKRAAGRPPFFEIPEFYSSSFFPPFFFSIRYCV